MRTRSGEIEPEVSAVRRALYGRETETLTALLAADPSLNGLDLAALGRAAELAEAVAADPELVRARSADGFTALHYACFFGGAESAKVLIGAGADAGAVAGNPTRLQPLHSAAAARDLDAAAALLAAGADPDAQQAGGHTPLHAAAQHDDVRLARLLLDHGADPAVRNEAGADADAIAAEHGAAGVLALLRDNGG